MTSSRLTNDTLKLEPRTELEGPELTFELSGLEIGCAEYDEGPTGCTVFHFPANEVENPAPESIGPDVVASELAWDAVLAAVRPGAAVRSTLAPTGP